MQQGGGSQSQHAEMTPATTTVGQQPVESASPISSRPPSNMDELIKLSSGGGDEDTEGDRAGGLASGNRWPRQETLALLKIRSDMDAGFRDATIKGPLWEDVSRKLAELGYKRSAKKCKEKFENVHKYYKRTKEGRAGRQDGKSYKFFSQLEALHTTTAATSNVSASISLPVTTVTTTTTTTTNTITSDVAPVSIGIPIPISSPIRIPPPSSTIAPMSSPTVPPNLSASATISPTLNVPGSSTTTPQPSLPPPTATATTTTTPFRITFSSDSSSSAETEDDDDDEDDTDFQGQPSTTPGSSHKRKRQSFSNTNRMMVFFESLMKQVMQKQESMQQRFLEVIEKREQERMIREEAWKRQEMARSAREHELMAQERAISASRDAAIISFLQKITGQAIQLPPAAPPPPPPASAPAPVVVASAIPVQTPTLSHAPLSIPQEQRDQQPQRRYQYQQLQQVHQSQHAEALRHQPSSTSLPSSEVVIAIPEQQVLPQPQEIGGSGSFESTSSRWPKVEVLALIKLRSGLEPRYQEAGPKGPLWEEISAGMQRMGYKRSAKRCKEKWENINKYFKKVKESNKKRPEDAKTCPYFHELDALYRKKIICSSSGTSSFSSQNRVEEPQQESVKLGSPSNPLESSNVPPIMPPPRVTERPEDKESIGNVGAQASNIGLESSLFEEGNGRSSKKPEGIVKELRNQQEMQQQQRAQSIVDGFDKYRYSEKMEHQEDDEDDEYDNEEDEDEDEDEDLEERKMSYKVEFQRQNANASNGGGNGTPSFMAVVQ